METIDVFYQVESCRGTEHLEVSSECTFGSLRTCLVEKHDLPADVVMFLEDQDDVMVDVVSIQERVTTNVVKVHVHRCSHIDVSVTYNLVTVHAEFTPGSTISRIKLWAAVKKFEMSEEDAGEHVLQIAGTHDRPSPGTHIGSLVESRACRIAFDLVPDERINGAARENDA